MPRLNIEQFLKNQNEYSFDPYFWLLKFLGRKDITYIGFSDDINNESLTIGFSTLEKYNLSFKRWDSGKFSVTESNNNATKILDKKIGYCCVDSDPNYPTHICLFEFETNDYFIDFLVQVEDGYGDGATTCMMNVYDKEMNIIKKSKKFALIDWYKNNIKATFSTDHA